MASDKLLFILKFVKHLQKATRIEPTESQHISENQSIFESMKLKYYLTQVPRVSNWANGCVVHSSASSVRAVPGSDYLLD